MKLLATAGPHKGLVLNLNAKDTWIIGRDPNQSSFVLEDSSVSRKHAEITKTPEGYLIKNLSITNPTEVNDEVIDEYFLQEKDKVKIGNTFFLCTALAEEDVSNEPIDEEDFDKKNLSENEEQTIFDEKINDMFEPMISDASFILKVISGPNAGSQFGMESGKSYIIGKDANIADIIFTDLSVSKKNTKILIDENKNIFIEDLGSKNGTYVNNIKIVAKTQITPSDLVTVGTTTFLVIAKEASQETIYSPAPFFEYEKSQEEKDGKSEGFQGKKEKNSWQKQLIPTRHLVAGGSLIIIFFVIFLSFFALFKAKDVEVSFKNPEKEIEKYLTNYPDIQFSYNPASAELFIAGHILTAIDQKQLMYELNQIKAINSITDNIVIDEGINKNFNDSLYDVPEFKRIIVKNLKPGSFILEGYVKNANEFQDLTDFANANFPYLDKLQNKVNIDQLLQIEIGSRLTEFNFSNLTFEIISGEIVVAGTYDKDENRKFEDMIHALKNISGIKSVKNLAVPTSESSARINLTKKYKITGSAQYDGKSFSVVANGKIVAIGDKLDGMLITAIEPNTVLLEKDELKYKINYSQ